MPAMVSTLTSTVPAACGGTTAMMTRVGDDLEATGGKGAERHVQRTRKPRPVDRHAGAAGTEPELVPRLLTAGADASV